MPSWLVVMDSVDSGAAALVGRDSDAFDFLSLEEMLLSSVD